VAHGGSGDTGVAGKLIQRWRDHRVPAIVFTGYIAPGTTGRTIVEAGRARFQRWNVHPTFADNVRLIEGVDPRRVIPAFGDSRFYATWRKRLTCEVVTTKVVVL